MFKSIRWTLQLWHAAILALALAGFGVALYFNIRTSQFEKVDREIEGAARVLGTRPLGTPGFRGGPRDGIRGREVFIRDNRNRGPREGRDG